MDFDSGLKVGEVITNRRLMDIFHCACEGGIRYASHTNTIVLVLNNTRDRRPDTWNDGILRFSGRPFKNDMTLSGANRRLEHFLNSKGDVFLFIVNQPGQYAYAGKVEAAGPIQYGASDNASWPIFPLKIISP